MIKKETNRYAYTNIQKLKRANKLKLNSVWNKWLPVKECEIYSFFCSNFAYVSYTKTST